MQFLVQWKLQNEGLWNILWTDESHLHMDGADKTYKCRIYAAENPHQSLPTSLHTSQVAGFVWIYSSIHIGSILFFSELICTDLVTYSVTCLQRASLLEQSVIPNLQVRRCVSTKGFLLNDALPHVVSGVKNVLWRHFYDDAIISHHFPTSWSARYLDWILETFGCVEPSKTQSTLIPLDLPPTLKII